MTFKLVGNRASVTVSTDGSIKRCSNPPHVVDFITTTLVRGGFTLRESIQHGVMAARLGRSLAVGQVIEFVVE